ncbi:MAG: ATP-binding protein [Mycolicibacterium sp.]|uniref:ATP-binding protein n=1 Tax=Mycolicibacterium sp. TaxID=2320850 RepID=UPI003D148042
MTRDNRRPRLAPSSWPVRWKVLVVAVFPLLLAGVLGGTVVYSSAMTAIQLRGDAERAALVPVIAGYLAALEATMIAPTDGGDAQAALSTFDTSRDDLRHHVDGTEVPDGVRAAVDTLLDDSQNLLGKIMGNVGDLRTQVMDYPRLLIAAETAIAGLLGADDRNVRAQGAALSGAIATRGQMVMQQMLVNHGATLPEPVLRSTMLELTGAESAPVAAMSGYLGVISERAAVGSVLGVPTDRSALLRSEIADRTAILSDPAAVLVANPELLASQRISAGIAAAVIAETRESIPATVDRQANSARSLAVRDAALVFGSIGLVVLLVTLVARTLVVPLRTLRDNALKVTHQEVAREFEHVRSDGRSFAVQPIQVGTSDEIGQVAHAFDELHKRVVQLAGEQARLQIRVTDMFDALAKRHRSLIDQQVALIERLECEDDDPVHRESLSQLDYLVARMRRTNANLMVLANAPIPRDRAESMSATAVVETAAAEVADRTRVTIGHLPDSRVAGSAAGDLVHILAELLDNALRYSPSSAPVTVSAVRTDNGGLVIEVADMGSGMTESDIRSANLRLQSGGDVNPYTARHMGLFVVGRLAAPHGLVIRLRSTDTREPGSGTTAGVYVPARQLIGVDPAPPDDVPDQSGAGPARLLPPQQPVADGGPAGRPIGGDDSEEDIYRDMLSEWPVDPHELSSSSDLIAEAVWNHGWAATGQPADPRARRGDGSPESR